ncbi:unnamed protein product [Soboliphyme baturini]|uniref:Peptidase S1 domain-containing protein n=1 Tax=Soboliphyme baturini TaxID=241478 RepID=A0A183I984_9BILA|nr:unnamed protein product [Soboliphyme baturini]
MNSSTCFGAKHYNSLKAPNLICAGFESGGKSTCQGDSGGALACRHKDGKFYVHGITSFGVTCASAKHPPAFTQVTRYLDWIIAHMK